MENLNQLKSIVDNAPDGATHYADNGSQSVYLKHNIRREFVYFNGKTFNAFSSKSKYLLGCKLIRSLSDINRIIELIGS